MAIKRLQRAAQFPCIGKLRKGGEKRMKIIKDKNGQDKEIEIFGEDLTYFRFDTTDPWAAKAFQEAYEADDGKPSVIHVFLPYDTTEQNFSCWQENWTGSVLQHRCDGETCVTWLDGKTYSDKPKPCPGGCKEVGRLTVIIPELQRFAYVTVETHSIHDIMRLTENLQAVELLRGSLQGIPFILKRTPVEISTPDTKGDKRVRREKWLLSIEVDPAWARIQLEAMHQKALGTSLNLPPVDESRLLTMDNGRHIDEETGEIIEPSHLSQQDLQSIDDAMPVSWDSPTDQPIIVAAIRLLHNDQVEISNDAVRLITKCREFEKSSGGKALSTTNKDGKGSGQYGLLADKIDTICNQEGAHNAVLSALCGYHVSSAKPPGNGLEPLIDWLVKNNTTTVQAITDIWSAIQKAERINIASETNGAMETAADMLPA